MKERPFDPQRLDVSAFAEKGAELSGQMPLADCQRLIEYSAPEVPPSEQDFVSWSARGELRPVRGQAPQVWLHLRAETQISMTCQRCLQPLPVRLEVERSLRFVPGEDAAAAEDAESEDDVLALVRFLDIRSLIEDELVLALPWVPRHETCPQPLSVPETAQVPAEEPEPHPFAALAQLKKRLDS